MAQYVSGVAAFTADNFIIEGDQTCDRHMLLPGCFDDFDFDSPVEILINHDWNERLGTVGDNAKLWMDGSKLRFTCLLQNTCAADRFREAHQHARVLGCSIRCNGFSETRYDSGGRPYKAITKVFSIYDVGPVSTARNPFCSGLTVSDRPEARTQAATNSAGGKRPKKLIILPPMPKAMMDGMKLMAAARAGQGASIGGRMLSSSQVASLVAGGQHSIR